MKRKILRLILAALSVLIAIGVVVYAAEPDDSHYSFRYQLWKRGRYSFRDGFKGAFMADASRESMVLGRTRQELAEKFAPLAEGRKNEAHWSDFYRRFRADDEFIWLWGSNWLVVLRDGKAIYLNYLKG
jgi:hypothetical protein